MSLLDKLGFRSPTKTNQSYGYDPATGATEAGTTRAKGATKLNLNSPILKYGLLLLGFLAFVGLVAFIAIQLLTSPQTGEESRQAFNAQQQDQLAQLSQRITQANQATDQLPTITINGQL